VSGGQWDGGTKWAVGGGQWAVERDVWSVGGGQWAVGSGAWECGKRLQTARCVSVHVDRSGPWIVDRGAWRVRRIDVGRSETAELILDRY